MNIDHNVQNFAIKSRTANAFIGLLLAIEISLSSIIRQSCNETSTGFISSTQFHYWIEEVYSSIFKIKPHWILKSNCERCSLMDLKF